MRYICIRAYRLNRIHLCGLVIILTFVMARIILLLAGNNGLPATSWAVANRVIAIDPGHGGIDPGAVGSSGLKEKDIVLQVAERLHKLLNQSGAKVIMTRKTDMDHSTPGSGSLLQRKREDLRKRVELAHTNNADFYVSIHVNAFPSSRWRGAQTFYQSNQPEGRKLAEAIQAEIIKILGNTTRAAKPGDFFTTRNTKMAAVIVEIGFISNPAEAKLLADPAYQRKLAYAIYSGLIKYYSEQVNDHPVPKSQ